MVKSSKEKHIDGMRSSRIIGSNISTSTTFPTLKANNWIGADVVDYAFGLVQM